MCIRDSLEADEIDVGGGQTLAQAFEAGLVVACGEALVGGQNADVKPILRHVDASDDAVHLRPSLASVHYSDTDTR